MLLNVVYSHHPLVIFKVKYGVLNIVNDPNGVKCCRQYGDSYLLLSKDTVRLRTTFASEDTSSSK